MSTALGSPHLMAALRQGDGRAQEELVHALMPRLVGMARVNGLGEADAEEVAQDTLSAVLVQLRQGRFEARSELGTWVHAIFKRRVIDRLRANARGPAMSVPLDTLAEAGNERPDPLTTSVDADVILRVQDALARLDSELRVILLLNVHAGYSAREIARVIRWGTKRVEARLTEAKKAFRRAYLATGSGPTGETAGVKRLK